MNDDPSKRPKVPEGEEGKSENAFEALEEIERAIENLRKPTGTQQAPAKTCKDLAMAHPLLESGTYWVDPNQGSPVDAIEVHCNMERKETCVVAKPNQVFKGTWYVGEPGHVWFGEEMEKGFPFTYKADRVQLTFLQLLSSHATQNITYHCRNSVAYYDAERKNYKRAAIFMTSNDLELVAKRPPKFRYSVKTDECQYRENKWATTVFEFDTEKTRRLPITDIAPFDIGDSSQGFGLEIGPVCFS